MCVLSLGCLEWCEHTSSCPSWNAAGWGCSKWWKFLDLAAAKILARVITIAQDPTTLSQQDFAMLVSRPPLWPTAVVPQIRTWGWRDVRGAAGRSRNEAHRERGWATIRSRTFIHRTPKRGEQITKLCTDKKWGGATKIMSEMRIKIIIRKGGIENCRDSQGKIKDEGS